MNDETDIELPQALIDRLQQRDHALKLMTPQIDRNIAAAAQEQFAAREGELSAARDAKSDRGQIAAALPQGANGAYRAKWTPAWGVAAAAAVAVMFIVITVRDPALPGDYDGSGSVNVLDAFALSHELVHNPQFAANDTVDSLMQRIVALNGGAQ